MYHDPLTLYDILLELTCADVHLEYSLDFGQTWTAVQTECMPSDVTCTGYHGSSTFKSDVYHDWKRVNMVLPHYVR